MILPGGLGYIQAKNKVNIIVYNPLELDQVKVKTEEYVDHSTKNSSNTNFIQKNADFTVSFGTVGSSLSYYASITDTSDYLDYYYLIFDLDIILKSDYDIRVRNDDGSFSNLQPAHSGARIEAGTLIKISKSASEFKATASNNNVQEGDIVGHIENNIILIGVSNNMPSNELENLVLSNTVKKYVIKNETITHKYINEDRQTNSILFTDVCGSSPDLKSYHDSRYTRDYQMKEDAYYFAMAKVKTANIGRIYDFKITDCSDIDYKSVFRKSESGNVNTSTGIYYFSGIKQFSIYTNEINTFTNRDNLNIESSSDAKTILPLGPYKSTNTSYVYAPKMGYRVSFDLKTSGYYDGNSSGQTREILIKPSYYYISKDAEDSNKFKNNINIYYKDSKGKYIKFVNSDYKIYFKPRDGYRAISNSITAGDTSLMSDKLEPLTISSADGFRLNNKMMSLADNKFIQAWYGEFKLPNSTIAVEDSNVSKPLTNGYLGVKFEIECVDNEGSADERRIGYNQNNRNDKDDSGNVKPNTTQWDYEGYLGFNDPGKEVDNLTLQLEKGIWKINNDTYKKVKGTVVLFDLDNRAANDFD